MAATVVATRPSRIAGRPDVVYQATVNPVDGSYRSWCRRRGKDEKYAVRVATTDPSLVPPKTLTVAADADQEVDVGVRAAADAARAARHHPRFTAAAGGRHAGAGDHAGDRDDAGGGGVDDDGDRRQRRLLDPASAQPAGQGGADGDADGAGERGAAVAVAHRRHDQARADERADRRADGAAAAGAGPGAATTSSAPGPRARSCR